MEENTFIYWTSTNYIIQVPLREENAKAKNAFVYMFINVYKCACL